MPTMGNELPASKVLPFSRAILAGFFFRRSGLDFIFMFSRRFILNRLNEDFPFGFRPATRAGLFRDIDPSPQICKPFGRLVFGLSLPEGVFPCSLRLGANPLLSSPSVLRVI